MATPLNYNFNDPNNPSNQQQGTTSAAPQTPPSMTGSTGPSSAPSAPPTQTNQTGTNSGQFTNIQSYLNANKDFNSQGGGLGGKMAGTLSNEAGQTKQDLGAIQNAFQSQADQSKNQFNRPDFAQNAINNATQFVQDPNNLSSFNQVRDASYTGPNSLTGVSAGNTNFNQVQNQTQNLQNLANQGTTESGRFNLLRNMFSSPNYSNGQQQLDNLILQSSPGQTQQLQGMRQVANQLGSTVGGAQTAAQGVASQYGNLAGQVRGQVAGMLGDENGTTGALGGLIGGLNTTAQQQEAARQANYSALQQGLANGTIDAATAAQMGLSNGAHTYGVNLGNYLGQDNLQANIQNVAQQSDFDRYGALAKLAGISADKLVDPTQAGTFNTNVGNLLQGDAAKGALAAAQAQAQPMINQDTNSMNASIRALQQGYSDQNQQAFNYLADQAKQALASGPMGQVSSQYASAVGQAEALARAMNQEGNLSISTKDQDVANWLANNGFQSGQNFETQNKAAQQAALAKLMGQQVTVS